jgi:Ankyrin repeats (3 copies)
VNLEQLRKQAKELVRVAREGDPVALDRLGDLPVRLSSAQLLIAREHRFSSWPALVHRLEASVESFVIAATSSHCDRARRLLDARPEIAGDRWARLVLGRGWDRDPSEVGGSLVVGRRCTTSATRASRASSLLARCSVAVLIRTPTSRTSTGRCRRCSALFGAAGVLHDPELTAVLLDYGADPNGDPEFGDPLYHSVEAKDPACLRLLLEHGADPKETGALGHALDYERPEHVRLLLDAGSEVEGRHLVHAVRRGRGVDYVRPLAERGADLDYRGGEWSTPPNQYRTAYQNAVVWGRDDVAELLADLGASTVLVPGDREVAAVARGERPGTPIPSELDHDQQEVVILAALGGQLELVVELLGPGFLGYVGGGPPGTLLHHGCWVGDPGVVARLLELGADPTAKSGAEFDTPIAWTALGSQWYRAPGRDYVAVAEQLLAAGAELEPRLVVVGEWPLADWLEERIAT